MSKMSSYSDFCRVAYHETPVVVEICYVNLCQAVSTGVTCLCLLSCILFLLLRFRKRCFDALLFLHHLRAGVELILLLISTLELAASCLPMPEPQGSTGSTNTPTLAIGVNPAVTKLQSTLIAPPLGMTNSILSIFVVIVIAIYHRIVEIKNYPEFLYLSSVLELILAVVRIYKHIDVTQKYDYLNLEPFLQSSSAILLTCLAIFDGLTIYKQRFRVYETHEGKKPIDSQKISYKHTKSTFFSKSLFWWLTPYLWQGYKEPFEPEDLGHLPEEDSIKTHYDQFLYIYKANMNKPPSLWLCYLKSSWKLFTLGGLFKLFGDLSALVGPLSIYRIVEYIEHQYENQQHQWRQQMANNNSSIIQLGSSTNTTYTRTVGIDVATTDIDGSSDAILTNAKIYYPNWNDLLSNGWVMAWLVLLASLIQGGLSQASTHIVNMIGIRIKTSLQALIYRKTLLLSSSCLYDPTNETGLVVKNSSNPQSQTSIKNAGAITNLMSDDALNVMSFFWIAHYVWAIPLKIGVVMYLLYAKLGISAIIGSLVCIATMTPLQFLIGKAMSKNSEKAAECTDERLKKTNDVFLGIKLIKLNAWERVFREKILRTRNKELEYLDKDSIYWTLMTFLTHVSSILITFVTLAVYTNLEGSAGGYKSSDLGRNTFILANRSSIVTSAAHVWYGKQNVNTTSKHLEFTASRLFSALALFNQLTVPLFIFPITVPIIISAIVSTKRLEKFFQEPEVQKEFEGIRNMARILSKSDASLDMYEKKVDDSSTADIPAVETDTQSQVIEEEEEQKQAAPLVVAENVDLGLMQQQPRSQNTLTRKKELIRNSRIEKSRQRQKSVPALRADSLQFQTSDNVVVSIHNSVFSWDKSNALLKVDKLQIPRGKLTVIVGKNGSGKTSLLAAFLKEMHLISGEIYWNKYSTIAYVPQTPWLLNSSIRDNILFGESFRPKRYDKVLEACALKPDIELMPSGDMTIIGERGINLSGGQKQRIVIARSLYSSANVVIMDNPFSSLDNEVAKHVFENSIKKMLPKANRTVILVTQKMQLVRSADYIIAMKDGTVEAAGTYCDIEKDYPSLIAEWNSIIAQHNNAEHRSTGKTARERWKLFKNVSKIGLQKVSHDQEHSSAQSLYMPIKRRPSIFGSRHLTYDMPLPIDECQNEDIIFRRRGSRRTRLCNSLELGSERRNVLRVNSLQPQQIIGARTPVARNISSPISLYSTKNRPSTDDSKTKTGFRHFLHRMSSRRSNTAVNARIHRTISASNSIKSITEESHTPVKRLMSDSSNSTDIMEEEQSVDDEEAKFEYDEERKYGAISAQIYWLYLKSCNPWIVFMFFITALVWQFLRVYTDVWLRDWADLREDEDIMYHYRMYLVISGVCIFMSLMSSPAGQWGGANARRILHENLLSGVLSRSLYFFQVTPLGRILNRFSNDMSIIDKKIAATSQRLLQFMLLCLCAVLINASITPWFLLLTIPICIAYYLIQMFYRCSSRELQRIESITNSPVMSHFNETIQGVTTIRAYSQEARFTEILFKRLETNALAFIILNSSNRWLGVALDHLGGAIVFVAIITALISVTVSCNQGGFTNGHVEEPVLSPSPSLVGLAVNYTLLIPIYLNWVVKLLADMEMYIGAVERVAFYGESSEIVIHQKNRIYNKVPISWPKLGNIAFENVSLRYEGQTDNVISDLTLRIPAGQRIGVCGRTGSGKSSLVLALFGVLEVVEGKIQIDDVDITAIHSDEIRSRLSIIPQDVYLFNGTIRENLDPCGHYPDFELWNCLEMAQLKDVVNCLPMKLDGRIIDGGTNLSAGQRQLFCLARAVLRGSACLILDEATSSLDSVTETALLKAAHNAFKGSTIITVAHRLQTLLDYDRIIVLENGKIIEDGTPKELQSNPDGKFSTMLKTGNT